jgi:hypothetical protein
MVRLVRQYARRSGRRAVTDQLGWDCATFAGGRSVAARRFAFGIAIRLNVERVFRV